MIVTRRRATKSRAPNGTGCTRRALPAVYSRLLDFRFLGGPTGGAPRRDNYFREKRLPQQAFFRYESQSGLGCSERGGEVTKST